MFKIIVRLICIAFVSFPILTNANSQNIPFTGKRWFNFMGGSGTGESIRINSSGTTVITTDGKTSSEVIYRGKYKRYFKLYGGENYYTIVGKNTIAMLDSNMNVMSGCLVEDQFCVVELTKETEELGDASNQFNNDIKNLDTHATSWNPDSNQNMSNGIYNTSQIVDVKPIEYSSSEPELDNVNDIFKE